MQSKATLASPLTSSPRYAFHYNKTFDKLRHAYCTLEPNLATLKFAGTLVLPLEHLVQYLQPDKEAGGGCGQ